MLGPYWLILGVVLYLTLGRKLLTAAYAVLAVFAVTVLQRVDYESTALLYAQKHHMKGAKTLYSVNSPYQKVEVIERPGGKRYLYLDGLQNLNSTDLESLNYYIAKIPAELIKPEQDAADRQRHPLVRVQGLSLLGARDLGRTRRRRARGRPALFHRSGNPGGAGKLGAARRRRQTFPACDNKHAMIWSWSMSPHR